MPVSSTVRLLHVTDRTDAPLRAYLAERGLDVDVRGAADLLPAMTKGGYEGTDYTHILLEGDVPAPWPDDLQRRWPSAKLIRWPDASPFLTAEQIASIRQQTGGKERRRRDWAVCALPAQPDLAAATLQRFHRAVNSLGKRRPGWRFLVPAHGPQCDPGDDRSLRVKVLGADERLIGVFALARCVTVLSRPDGDLLTALLEAIQCKAWVLTTPQVLDTLPPELRPYCAAMDLDAPGGFDEALDRSLRKEWPAGDPNEDLKSRAYEALEHALFENPQTHGRRSSSPAAEAEATFCTVVTPLHTRMAAHNNAVVAALNARGNVRWNVVDNHVVRLNNKWSSDLRRELRRTRRLAPAEDTAQEGASGPPARDVSALLPGTTIHDGLTLEQAFEYFADDLRATSEDDEEHLRLLTKYLASYHHASGLDIALEHVRTRYAVVIDPDLYVVRPDWLHDVIAWMSEHDLALFGTPWNPRWYQKVRYFPCSHLMVIDLQKYPWRRDMLMPDLVRSGIKYVSRFWLDYAGAAEGPRRSAAYLLRHALHAMREDMRQRATIQVSRDTGYRMFEEFRRRPELRAGTVQAVCAPDEDFQPPAVTRLQRALDRILPDRWSYMPKRADHMTAKGFGAFGYPDCRSLGWEEFLWKGEPFAFHVRGELQRQSSGVMDDVEVWNRLNAVLRRLGRREIPDHVVAGRS
jgi:hypothetical protein